MTLTADTALKLGTGNSTINHFPVIGSDTIYNGSAVGLQESTGYARPLVAGDQFRGFANEKVDNASGSAGDLDVEVQKRGVVELSVTGAVITDVDQAVYATDENTFQFSPVGGSFVGFISRWISSGVVEVEFDVDAFEDPYGGGVYEGITGAKTLDIQDAGKTFFVTATAVVTLPATAVAIDVTLVNMGAFGTVQISADPVAADKIMGPDIAGTDNKDLINTLATAQRGDLVTLRGGHADGFFVDRLIGTWATEA